jgi:vacuole morphology and inheritance protein 14
MQGGLLCLAAIAVGLGPEDNDRFLDVIVPPVLDSFRDPDSGVRYYGLEALYNIAKVSRESFLRYFSDTFDSLFRLCADSEHRVQVWLLRSGQPQVIITLFVPWASTTSSAVPHSRP